MQQPNKVISGKTILFAVSLLGLFALAGAFHSPYWLYIFGFATPHIFFSTLNMNAGELVASLAPAYTVGIILFAILATQTSRHALLATSIGMGLYALDSWAAVSLHLWASLPLHALILLFFVAALKKEYLSLRRARKVESRPPPRLETVINRQVTIGRPGLKTQKPYLDEYDEEEERAASRIFAQNLDVKRRTYHGRKEL